MEEPLKEKVDVTYLEGGHFICDEQPEAVAKAIQNFLT